MTRDDRSEGAGPDAFPGEVTRPAGGVADFEAGTALQWRCTVVWHPDATRIGAVARLPHTQGPLLFGRGAY